MGKKLQPKLRFRGFTDAWEPRRLKSLHRQPLLVSPVPSQTYISWSVPAFSTGEPEIVKGSEIESVKQSVNSSDVLLCRINPRINRVWVVEARKDTDLPMIASTEWVVFTGHNSDSYFLSALFTSSRFRNMLLSEVAGVTGSQKRFQIASVLERQEYFPTQIEQARIGLLFAKVDNLIAAEKRKLDLLKQKKKALLHQIFEQKLRFKGYNNPWERRKGSDIIHVRKETNSKPLTDTVDIELENLIEGGGLQGDISLRTASTSVFREHDTLFGRLRPYLRKCWLADISGVKSGEIWALFSPTLKSEFLYALTQSAQFLNPALQTAGTKMPRAEWKAIAEACFTIPETDEQEKIGQLFRQLEHLTAVETRKIDLLSVKKKALLQKMFV
ncbi:type I restriction enzyme specificity protein [Bifidobacterium pseudolongum subsp. pseudolongum]|nr:type I restriction enzyme specificity protein [Bifidobacterium pseudolongum subsp. pseudolongum]